MTGNPIAEEILAGLGLLAVGVYVLVSAVNRGRRESR